MTTTIDSTTGTAANDVVSVDLNSTSSKGLKRDDVDKDDDDYPMAPDSEWPDAWIMIDTIPDDGETQCLANKLEPNVPVTVDELKQLGICFWKLDAESYDYPIRAVPWDPNDAVDPKLKSLRDKRGYSYADIITIHPDYLPEFDAKIKNFFEEVSFF
jgi:ARD/ARD' family